MEETLKVDKKKLLVLHEKADKKTKELIEQTFGKSIFKGSLEDRIQNFSDICREAGENPDDYVLPESATQRQIGFNAIKKLLLIYEVANEGWVANYSNSNQPKFYPWFQYTAGSGFSFGDFDNTRTSSDVGARLSTFSKERAEWIARTFREEYNQFLIINNN